MYKSPSRIDISVMYENKINFTDIIWFLFLNILKNIGQGFS